MEFIVVSEQLTYILYSVIYGLFVSLIYTLIKIVRIATLTDKSKVNSVISEILFIHILDIIYFTFIGVTFSIFVYTFNHGRIRWYLVLGAVFGFWIWYNSIGRLIMFISEYVVRALKSFTSLLIYVIMMPVRLMIRPLRMLWLHYKRKIVHSFEMKKIKKLIFEMGESNGT